MQHVKEFISNQIDVGDNSAFTEAQYSAWDKFTDGAYLAWAEMPDGITRPYWGSTEKPESPTRLFIEMYIEYAQDDEISGIVEAFNL